MMDLLHYSNLEVDLSESHASRESLRTDTQIYDEVLETFLSHPELVSHQIEVEVSQGHITLKGFADSQYTRANAEYLIGRLPGVKDIDNFIVIDKELEGSVDSSLSGQDSLILKTRKGMN